jgi:small subunit ribosomal protein S1
VARVLDFGAFVEIEPGMEGLIHISEMSWAKKVRTPSEVVKPGETVEVVILGVSAGERRISLGLKQTLGDPWADAAQKFAVSSVIEGSVTSLTRFGAFVQLSEGVEGMIHISDMSAEKRISHPQDILKVGQLVKAQVLEIDTEKRRLKLGMKQLTPTSIEEYIAERQEGDVVSGRVLEVSGQQVRVELGEGIQGTWRIPVEATAKRSEKETPAGSNPDLSLLSSMLQARWKGGAAGGPSKPDGVRPGQVRSFRVARLDTTTKKIDLDLA